MTINDKWGGVCCNFVLAIESTEYNFFRVQRTENRVQLPCGVKTPCKGIIYIAKGNALDRVQLPFGLFTIRSFSSSGKFLFSSPSLFKITPTYFPLTYSYFLLTHSYFFPLPTSSPNNTLKPSENSKCEKF